MKSLALVLILALPAYAQESDAPKATKLHNGSVLFNKPAFDKLDDELKRLQQVEREHKTEPSWVIPVAIGAAVGLVVGAAVGASVALAVKPSP